MTVDTANEHGPLSCLLVHRPGEFCPAVPGGVVPDREAPMPDLPEPPLSPPPLDVDCLLPQGNDSDRFARIAEALKHGALHDLTPESVAWFADQASLMQWRLRTNARHLHDVLYWRR